jgi:hypothetical protein
MGLMLDLVCPPLPPLQRDRRAATHPLDLAFVVSLLEKNPILLSGEWTADQDSSLSQRNSTRRAGDDTAGSPMMT